MRYGVFISLAGKQGSKTRQPAVHLPFTGTILSEDYFLSQSRLITQIDFTLLWQKPQDRGLNASACLSSHLPEEHFRVGGLCSLLPGLWETQGKSQNRGPEAPCGSSWVVRPRLAAGLLGSVLSSWASFHAGQGEWLSLGSRSALSLRVSLTGGEV